jgi:hypothetical protein
MIDVLIGGGVALVLWRAIQLWRLTRARGALTALWEGTRRLLRAVAAGVLVFMLAWGCNYRRQPLSFTLGAAPTPSVAVLEDVIAKTNALGARLRPMAAQAGAPGLAEVADLLRAPLGVALARLNREPLARSGRPKTSILLTPFFVRAGVDGMVDPFVLESIISPDLLPFERPFVLAHEWAHLAGQADEAEASAVGWFACMNGPPVLAYSANVYLILEAAASLPPAARRRAFDGLDPGIREDLSAVYRRVQRQQPQVRRVASGVYDQYLKANRVADGNASYTRALRLILAPPLSAAIDTYPVRAR